MRLACKFVINKVAGDNIAVPVGADIPFRGYIRINETGKDIFELLKNDTDRRTVISELKKMYPDAEDKEISESVDDVIEKLSSAGLLISDI